MSTILIIFCACNKIMTNKTKKFTNTSNKKSTVYLFFILQNVSCTIEIIGALKQVYVSFMKNQIDLEIFIFEFHFLIFLSSNAICSFTDI